MRTHTVELFSITELDEKAQEKAVDYLRDLDYFGAETDDIESMFKERLEEYGLPTEQVEFSLGHRQGDGVAFYGDIDVEKLLKNIGEWDKYAWLVNHYKLSATSTRNSWGSHYSHFNTMDVDMEHEYVYHANSHIMLGQELLELIKLRVVSVSKELESMGYKEIEYRQEKEQIIEMADINEMEFRKDGRLWAG